MFIRRRKENWSLERAVYKPAVKDAQGNIITHPVRTTEYVGSVKSYSRFAYVKVDLLQKLSEEEKAALRDALKENEPKPDRRLNQLANTIRCAAGDIKASVDSGSGSDVATRKQLEATIKGIDDAWLYFFKTAQEHGLKRKARRPTKALTQPEAGNAPSHS